MYVRCAKGRVRVHLPVFLTRLLLRWPLPIAEGLAERTQAFNIFRLPVREDSQSPYALIPPLDSCCAILLPFPNRPFLSMSPKERRTHKKSRLGCAECKKRHIRVRAGGFLCAHVEIPAYSLRLTLVARSAMRLDHRV